MRLFFYYVSHTFINSIKKLFHTWVAVFFGCLLLFGVLIGAGSVGLISFLESNDVIEGSEDAYDDNYIEETESSEEPVVEMTPGEKQQLFQVLTLAIAGLIYFGTVYHIFTADKGGSSIFLMPDVNLLFPAPKKPQSVLLFKILLQMGLLFAASLYLIFQIPNLVINLGLSLPSVLLIFLCYLLALVFYKLAAIFTYTLTATHLSLRIYVKPFSVALLFVPLLLFIIVRRILGKSFYETALLLFCSKGFFAVPMVGWLTGFASGILYENGRMTVFFLCLILTGLALFTYLIWNMKADFYEDALTSAWTNTEKLEAAQNGMGRKKHPKKTKTMEDFTEKPLFREGAKAFFDKILYNWKRFAKLGIFSNAALLYLVSSMIAAVSLLHLEWHSHGMTIIGCILAAFVFFRNFGNPLETELQANYLFLVPESPYRKVFYSLLGCSCQCFLDVLPGMLIAQIALREHIYMVFFWVLFIVSLDFMASSTGFFMEMALPISLNEVIKAIFQLFLKSLALMPLLISLIICVLLSHVGMTLFLSSILNILFASIITCASASLLHTGRS